MRSVRTLPISRQATASAPIWFGDILRLEPRIANLAAGARRGEFRNFDDVELRLGPLVGALATCRALRSAEAWSIALRHLRREFDRRDRRSGAPQMIGGVVYELLGELGLTSRPNRAKRPRGRS